MKAILLSSLGIALAISIGTVRANDLPNPEKAGALVPPAATKVVEKGLATPTLAGLHEHLQQMQQQIEKIQHSKDAAEKDQLMQEYLRALLDHMKMMQGMMSGGMMMGGNMPPQMIEQRLKIMEQRLDQMQRMLDKPRPPADKK